MSHISAIAGPSVDIVPTRKLSRRASSSAFRYEKTTLNSFISRKPQKKLRRAARLKNYLYNKETHAFCNRTCINWLAVISYYLIFISCIFALFLIMIFGGMQYLKVYTTQPWVTKKNFIEDNIPGISFFPDIDELGESIIWYQLNNKKNNRNDKYIQQIESYYKSLEGKCRDNCTFNRSSLGPCGEGSFGYDTLNPCIIIKINKLEDWVPKAYPHNKFPAEMPRTLQQQILNSTDVMLWITCTGIDEYDEDLIGTINYYPAQGFSADAFPYTLGDDNYVSPVVTLHLANITAGRVLGLTCSLWASNYEQEMHYNILVRIFLYILE